MKNTFKILAYSLTYHSFKEDIFVGSILKYFSIISF